MSFYYKTPEYDRTGLGSSLAFPYLNMQMIIMERVISCYFSVVTVKTIRYDCSLDRNPVKLMNCAYLFSVCPSTFRF